MCFFFFFNDTATTEIYTLSLHDALPIFPGTRWLFLEAELIHGKLYARNPQAALGSGTLHGSPASQIPFTAVVDDFSVDRKSTRLNSSHANISYAVFCLKKKNKK